jgi:hypothetical protein
MSSALAFVAFVGFVLAAMVHAASVVGIDVSERFELVWFLHVGMFVVFIPFVNSSRKLLGARPTFSDWRSILPRWAVVGCGVVFIYAIVNFAIYFATAQTGNALVRDGKYVVRGLEVTKVEYAAFRASHLRGFSGHWLVFYFLPFAYFGFGREPDPSFKRTPDGAAQVKR